MGEGWRSGEAPSQATRIFGGTLRRTLVGIGLALVCSPPTSDAASGPKDDGIFAGSASAAALAALPSGFQEEIVFSGLPQPIGVRFLADGRAFVVEKSGRIKVFDSLSDTTPTDFANLSRNVHDSGTGGCSGSRSIRSFRRSRTSTCSTRWTERSAAPASDRQARDAPLPRWTAHVRRPPGPPADGCVIGARLSRLQAYGNVMTGTEQVLIEDWCQQYPSHSSAGTSPSAPTDALRDGRVTAPASRSRTTGGREPAQPVRRPAGGVGATLTPPTAEGGALRSQDLRTGDPDRSTARSSGSTRRREPPTSQPVGGQPRPERAPYRRAWASEPFRFTFRPGTTEVWVGDVGWNDWEEINRVLNPTTSSRTSAGPATRANPTAGRLRRREPEHLREPLRGGGCGHPVLRVPPLRTLSSPATAVLPAARRSPDSRSTSGGSYPSDFATPCSSPITAGSASG